MPRRCCGGARVFEPAATPRLFGLPPGADFPARLAQGLVARLAGAPPEAMARVEIWVNTQRMRRRLGEILAASGPRLLPRLRLVTELGADPALPLPPAVPPLRRRLELAGLVRALIAREPDLAPRSAAFALADSLARLIDEMHGEGVAPEALDRLDLGDLSAHWERSRRFLAIVAGSFGDAAGDPEARQRRAVELVTARWAAAPPDRPVIVAGSTGSRGATALFMAAVARLPQGAVVLPGFDFDLPAAAWASLAGDDDRPPAEDHPQYRFARLAARLGAAPGAVRPWDDAPAPSPARNRLVSLALRPAPATDQWLDEGPSLGELAGAASGMTLIEAPDPGAEAAAVALRLRGAVAAGQTAALVTPDRMLTRRVAAELDRWGIVPDDSAGRPLALTPPGRFLLHAAELMLGPPMSETVLALLKHPLCHTGAGRGAHLLNAHELELWLRRTGRPFPGPGGLDRWVADRPARPAWAGWLHRCLAAAAAPDTASNAEPLDDLAQRHRAAAEMLAAGAEGGESALWREAAGEAALAAIEELSREAPHGGLLTPADFLALLRVHFEGREVRESVAAHPGVMIWGTLEARVQGAEVLILAGLNDGVWPDLPPPDPWMSRRMRRDAGLLLPERRVGLAAHDFQQAIAAAEVVLSRSLRDAEAETVPSRWVNRLTTLLAGLPEQGGPAALAAMRERGEGLVAAARQLALPASRVPPVPRPSPRPPVAARPGRLSVTDIQTLIRDPYAIYARRILDLRPLDPLRPAPDTRERGSALHRVFEVFLAEVWPVTGADPAAFRATAARVLAEAAPWPAARIAWAARLDRVAGWFLALLAEQAGRQAPRHFEVSGEAAVGATGIVLHGKADRIDLRHADGRALIYDYKTGAPPSEKEQRHFDRQLPLLAALAERGAFAALGAVEVAATGHVALTAPPKLVEQGLAPGDSDVVWEELGRLLAAYGDRARGYTSRRAPRNDFGARSGGDYDHLARHGEWEGADPPAPEDVG